MNNILILTNNLRGLELFRKELIIKLIDKGYKAFISYPETENNTYFQNIDCIFIRSPIVRRGTNIIKDLMLIFHYLKIIKKIRPNIVLTYTVKPNIYGGLASTITGTPYISNITGLGNAVFKKGFLQTLVLFLTKNSLKKAECVFFQNRFTNDFFIMNKIINSDIAEQIPGSGVNLDHHCYEEYPDKNEIIKFLYIGRIMKEKGIDEFLAAVQRIKNKYKNIEFHLLGGLEELSYKGIIDSLSLDKTIKYHGSKNNIHLFIKNSHATINPSYHEGMSNVLLESASSGRPVIASRIPGCIETFEEGITGFGFEPKNVESLTEAIIKFIELPYEEKVKMGVNARKKMELEFDRNIVIKAYLNQINIALGITK